ncbi:Protein DETOXIFICATION 44, chloroplastic [Linum perenne]
MAAAVAAGLSRELVLGACSLHANSSTRSRTILRSNANCSIRSLTVPKSLSKKNASASGEPSTKPPVVSSSPDSDQGFERDESPVPLLRRVRDAIRFDELGLEIWSIALPAALALAADPITSLVDTAFVGHIGPVELAAVGVSVSVFNLVSKLFNVPLLNITTSFVAEEQALLLGPRDSTDSVDTSDVSDAEPVGLPSVSTSLILAAIFGVAEAAALYVGSGFIMNIMGIPAGSPMRAPAEQFLTLRAIGAPPIVIALAAQGAFRGFKDTKTPLYAIGKYYNLFLFYSSIFDIYRLLHFYSFGNLLNAILDPILIFAFSFGIGGAAVATVISEYLIAGILLWKLNEQVKLVFPDIDGRRLLRYLNSGGLLIGRTIAVLLTMTLSTSLAARGGPIPMAGHQICMEVWLAVSLLNDALAIAGQALLASSYSEGQYEQARQVTYKVLQIGLVTGIGLGVTLLLGFGAFASIFTTDTEVLKIAWSGVWFVAGSQPVNAIAFVIDGLYYGVSDFAYAAYSMVIAGLVSSLFVLVAAPIYGLPGIWAGLFLFMILRVLAGIWRLTDKTGPWKMVWAQTKQGTE